MKKPNSIILLFLFTIALLTLTACLGNAPTNPPVTELPTPEAQMVNGISIGVDPRIELLNMIQYIGKENIHSQAGIVGLEYTDYRLEIDKHFRQYDQHNAVKYYDAIEFNDLSEPTEILLLMNKDFTVNGEAFDAYQKAQDEKTFADAEKLQELFDQLQDFYIDSDFQKFYDGQREFYKSIVSQVADAQPKENLVGLVEDFFREKANGYTVNLVTIQTGGYGSSLIMDGKMSLYSTNGPEEIIDHKPFFGNTAFLAELEIHEFSHNFIPISGEIASPIGEQIKQSEYLHEAVREDMKSLGYRNWDSVLEETILRACVVHIVEAYDPERGAAILQEERDSGVLYIDCVYESMEKYLANKSAYPTFQDFLPVIMEDMMSEWKQ